MVSRLGVDIVLLHLNELNAAQESAVRRSGSPVVLAVLDHGPLSEVLGPTEIVAMGASVELFEGRCPIP